MSNFTQLFPPIVESYLPAFDAQTDFRFSTFRFYFQPSIANTITQVKSLMLRFRRVNTNSNPLPINTYPYEVMWFGEESITLDKSNGKYFVDVPVRTFLSGDAQTENPNIPNFFKGLNEFYKVQVRFSPYKIRKESEASGRWEYLLPDEDVWVAMNNNFMISGYGKFSEWSSATLIKPITIPRVTLVGFEGFLENTQDWPVNIMPTASFNFVGTYTAGDSSELLKKYRFRTIAYDFTKYSNQGPDNNKVIEDSGWKNVGEYDALNINWINRVHFKNQSKFWIELSVETINGFMTSVYYLMEAKFTEFDTPVNLRVMAVPDLAKVEITLDTTLIDTHKVNRIAILRTSSRTSDMVFDEIVTFEITEPGDVTYSDYFIEAGVKYKYYVQSIGIDGTKGAVSEYQEVIVDYDYSWIVGENFLQCSIEYNGNLSSFRRTRKDTIIETIGGAFPVVASNSKVGYIDMTYGCTITQHMDKENRFGGQYSELFGGLQDSTIDDFYQISLKDKIQDYKENYITEREFRKNFGEWIQDGKAKIYKSNTEGLILVRVVDYNTTPVQQLGRIISNASFRMVEIGEVNHQTLVQFGLRKEYYTDKELREIAKLSKPYPEVNLNPALTGYNFVRKDW